MQYDQFKISKIQMVLLIVGFLIGTSNIISRGIQAKHDAWIAIMLGTVEGIVFASIYCWLCKRFFGKNLLQIHEIVFGVYFGKVVTLLLLWYFIHLCSLVIASFAQFISATVMPLTPNIIFSILMLLVTIYAVYQGFEVIARCSQILVSILIGFFLIIFLLLFKDIKLQNFQPLLEVPIKDLVIAAHGTAVFPFGGTIVFGMLIPYFKKKQAVFSTFVLAFILSGTLLVLETIKNIGVLGASIGIYAYQNFQADRLLDIGNLINRLEIITVIGTISMGFVKIAILLHGTVVGLAQFLGLRTFKPLIFPIAILMVILAQTNFTNVAENLIFAEQIYPIYALFFQVGIPLLTLIIAFIRRVPKIEN